MTDPTLPPQPAEPPYEPVYEPVSEPVPPARKSRRGVVIGASAAVLALVAGAAVWATTTLSGGGRQPDEVVPRTTFAYLKVDLDPGIGQKLAARSFFAKIPSLKPDGDDEETVFEDVVADLISDDLDYDRDVKPWFDKRAAIAAFPAPGGPTPHLVLALRSKDDDKARAVLDREVAKAAANGGDAAYRITKGYAVLGSKESVEEAVRLTETESLRDNATYTGDVDRLDGDQVAVGWTDVAQTFDAAKGAIPGSGFLPGFVTDQVKGRLVAGLHLTGDYAEVQGLALGAPAPRAPAKGGDHALLTGLPADTAAAFSGFGVAAGATADPDTAGLLDMFLGDYLQGSGLSFTDDLLPLLGNELAVAVGPSTGFDDLRAGLVSKVEDGSLAAAAGSKIGALLQFLGLPVKADVSGERFVLATPAGYGDQLLRGGGGLGTSEKFGTAMGDLRGSSFALYADLPAVARIFGQEARLDRGLSAVGVVGGYRGTEGYFRMRLVAG